LTEDVELVVVILEVGTAAAICTCRMVVRSCHEHYTSEGSSPEERHLEVWMRGFSLSGVILVGDATPTLIAWGPKSEALSKLKYVREAATWCRGQ
jgi:hypothetical protein